MQSAAQLSLHHFAITFDIAKSFLLYVKLIVCLISSMLFSVPDPGCWTWAPKSAGKRFTKSLLPETVSVLGV